MWMTVAGVALAIAAIIAGTRAAMRHIGDSDDVVTAETLKQIRRRDSRRGDVE